VPASVTAGIVANGKKTLPPQSASSSGTAAAKQQQQHPRDSLAAPAKEAKKQQQNATTAAAEEELEREKQQHRRILLVLGFIMCLAVSGAVAVLWSSSSASAVAFSPTGGAFDAASGDRFGARAGHGGPSRAGDGYGKRAGLRSNGGSFASPSSSRSHNLMQNGGRGPLTADEPSQSFVATGGSPPRFHYSQRTHQRAGGKPQQDRQREHPQTGNQPTAATSLLDAFEISKQPPSLLDAAFEDL
jgi:hypothetical protein